MCAKVSDHVGFIVKVDIAQRKGCLNSLCALFSGINTKN